MSERMSVNAQNEAKVAALAAEQQSARQVTDRAIADNEAFDKGLHLQAEANVLNKQIDQGAVMAEKVDEVESKRMSIEARRTSPDVQAMNQAAEIEIFGSRGQTKGYVDKEGKPITEPIIGIVDKIRGISQADEIRKNPRYGTKKSDREAAAAAYEAKFQAGQDERDARAESYVKSIDDLQAEGFELSQARLVSALSGEVGSKQQELFSKLVAKEAAGKSLTPEEEQRIRSGAVDRVIRRTVRDGDDVGMLKRIIKQEGLFDRDELNKFRYKRGNPKNGERKEFTAYREQAMADFKDIKDIGDRNNLVNELNAKTILREQRRVQKEDAEADAAARRREEAERAEAIPVTDPSSKGIRARIRNMMIGAAFALGTAAGKAREYFSDEEKGKRRKVTGAVVGAVAVASLAYLELKSGGSSGGSHGSEAVMTPSVKPQHHEAAQHAQSVVHNGNGGVTAPETHKQVKQAVTELKPGGNPWDVSEHRLHELGNAHPSAAQIEHFDKEMAQANPDVYSYGGDSSEHIPAGTELKLPR